MFEFHTTYPEAEAKKEEEEEEEGGGHCGNYARSLTIYVVVHLQQSHQNPGRRRWRILVSGFTAAKRSPCRHGSRRSRLVGHRFLHYH